jgi:hypothetical protein
MKYKLATTLLVVAGLVVATFSAATTTARPALAASGTFPVNGCPVGSVATKPPCDGDDVILKWDEQLLASIRANPPLTGPTITARALGVLHTATYDAWAAYDKVAKGTRLGSRLRQPQSQHTLGNKNKAISYAAYRVLLDLFPARKAAFDAQMGESQYQYDPNDLTNFNSTDPVTAVTTPQGVGNRAAYEVITFRHGDGSNQTFNANGPGIADDTVTYPDPCTTNCYSAKNTWNTVSVPWHWQPLCVLTADGATNHAPPVRDPGSSCPDQPTSPNYTVQKPLTPHWGNITTFATSAGLSLLTGPPKNPDGTYSTADVVTALADTSNLDDVKKTKAEYWADGPKSEFPPGHMAVFAQALSRKNSFTLDTNVKMFFALGNAMLDSSIAAWSAKYKDTYDFWRPVTAIRHLYKDKDVTSWRGPGASPSFDTVKGQNWMPYQALTVVTPGFPEYVSGHSTFSAAGGYVLRSFTTSDIFGGSVTIPAGSSKIEPGTPATNITLTWPTFTAAADEAGMSRRYGGIHFFTGDVHGRMLGDTIGRSAYAYAQAYIQGKLGS